jgi:phosphopentomutase
MTVGDETMPPKGRRAFLIVIDSAGCGGAPDAAAFGDPGANTLAHIAQACAADVTVDVNADVNVDVNADVADGGRSGPLFVPNMAALGLGRAVALASGDPMPGVSMEARGLWGAATEVSSGKDTPSGHWELAGVPVPWDWHYFPRTDPAFPAELMHDVCRLAGTTGTLGNCHASGTAILEQLGARHLETGWPICYTSSDSVFQIAAHEEHFGLQRLLDLCAALAPALHAMRVGRVIARPFVGSVAQGFTRTGNRHDFAVAPPAPTLCDWVQAAGRAVYGVGKIGDIFSGRGIDEVRKGDDATLMKHLDDLMEEATVGSLVFANLVEFDSLFGHRRDVSGYARALERFDAWLGRFVGRARPGDLVLVTADHGNDPTWRGTDHTRERVPVLIHGKGAGTVGLVGFADVGVSIAHHLGVPSKGPGRSFL